MKISIVGFLALSLLFFSCKAKKTGANECATFLVTYNSHVKSIVDVNCANTCHSASNKAAGIDLSSYEKVKSLSTQSKFLGAVRHLAGFSPMPKKAPKMSDSSIQILTCWVKNGTPE